MKELVFIAWALVVAAWIAHCIASYLRDRRQSAEQLERRRRAAGMVPAKKGGAR